MHSHVTIIGTGKIGSALSALFARQGIEVQSWNITAEEQNNPAVLRSILPGARAVFLCVPSWAIRPAAQACRTHLDRGTPVVSVAKGIELSSGLTMDAVLTEVLGSGNEVALLSGPMIAKELGEGRPCAGVIATLAKRTFDVLQPLFAGSNVSVEYSDDVRGVALAGVLKNVYAIAVGRALARHTDEQTSAAFVADAKEEMVHVGLVLGAREETIRGTAGFGDFMVTAFSSESRNRSVGEHLDDVHVTKLESEGLFAVQLLAQQRPTLLSYPIYHSVYDAAVRKSVSLQSNRG